MTEAIQVQWKKGEQVNDSKSASLHARRTRQRLKRMQTAQEIRKRVSQGQGNSKIIKEMGLAERTFYRLLNEAFEDDLKKMQEQSVDAVVVELSALKTRLLAAYQRLLKTCEDQSISVRDRLTSESLLCELSIVIFRISREGPLVVREFSDRLQ